MIQTPGWFIWTMAEMRSAVPSQRPGSVDGLRERVAVDGEDGEGVAGEGEAADLSGATVEDVEEDAFAWFDADGFAVAKHAAVDGEGVVADFVPRVVCPWLARLSSWFRRIDLASRGSVYDRREHVDGHVSATAEGGLEFFEDEEDLAVVLAGLVRWGSM